MGCTDHCHYAFILPACAVSRGHSSGLSLQRVTTLPLAICMVKQRRSGLADSAAAGASVLGGADCAAGLDGIGALVAAGGGLYAGVTLSRALASPASLSPSSLQLLPGQG